MTRGAVEAGFRRFVDELIDVAYREFNVARALRNGRRSGPGQEVVDRLLKRSETLDSRVVRPELMRYRDDVLAQFDVVLDYAAGDRPFEAYADEILELNLYYRALRDDVTGDRRAEIRDRILGQQRRLGDAAAPLVDSPADAFWDAVRDALDRQAAMELIETHFAFTAPIREYRGAFVFRVEVDPGDILGGGLGSLLGGSFPAITVEFTDEAFRAMTTAERAVISEVKSQAADLYADG